MVMPSTLTVLVIGASMVIFTFLWRMLAAHFAENSFGQAMAAML